MEFLVFGGVVGLGYFLTSENDIVSDYNNIKKGLYRTYTTGSMPFNNIRSNDILYTSANNAFVPFFPPKTIYGDSIDEVAFVYAERRADIDQVSAAIALNPPSQVSFGSKNNNTMNVPIEINNDGTILNRIGFENNDYIGEGVNEKISNGTTGFPTEMNVRDPFYEDRFKVTDINSKNFDYGELRLLYNNGNNYSLNKKYILS